jgi:hypothetical protein
VSAKLFVLAFFANLALSPLALARDDAPTYWRVIDVAKGEFLNMRQEPSLDAKIIKRIPADTRRIKDLGFEPLPRFPEAGRYWHHIEFEGTAGWASRIYLQRDVD